MCRRRRPPQQPLAPCCVLGAEVPISQPIVQRGPRKQRCDSSLIVKRAANRAPAAAPRSNLERFGKVVKLTAFKPFSSAANALEQINAISEAQLTDDLKNFLALNLPKVGARARRAGRPRSRARGASDAAPDPAPPAAAAARSRGAAPWREALSNPLPGGSPASRRQQLGCHERVYPLRRPRGPRPPPPTPCHHSPNPAPPPAPPPQAKEGKKPKKFQLGVFEAKLGSAIQEATGVPCVCNELVGEVLRGCRLHFTRFIGDLKEPDLKRAQLGLAHSYSRAKVGAGGGGCGGFVWGGGRLLGSVFWRGCGGGVSCVCEERINATERQRARE
jgi:hypothetical protein